MALKILSGGAANGLVNRLRDEFRARTGLEIEGDFGAVGGMRDRIAGGEAVDLAILTRAAIDTLAASGHVSGDTITDVGHVSTGVAVLEGGPVPDVADGEGLRALFGGASRLYCPDTKQATAGIHVAKVLDALGLTDTVTLSEHPNGQTAMAKMVAAGIPSAVGCTQETEILNTDGVVYAGDLPGEYGLRTVYTAAIGAGSDRAKAAQVLIDLMTAAEAEELRRSVGFS